MTVIITLTLIAGRKERGQLCLHGALSLLHLAIFLWPATVLYYLISYFGEISHYGNALAVMLAPLSQKAGLPWSSAMLACTAAGFSLFVGAIILRSRIRIFHGDRYKLSFPGWSIICCLMAACLFFLALCLINWPFAGLPPDLPKDRAIMAILRAAMREFFMSFCPAGAFALAGIYFIINRIPRQDESIVIRWPAVWAAVGALPHLLQNWGMLAGLGLGGRLSGSLSQGLWAPALGLLALTMAAFCWCWIIWKPRTWRFLAPASLLLLLLKAGSPLMLVLARQPGV